MNEKIKRLLELSEENPTLPIIPMVWEEVVADCTTCYWRGSIGEVKVCAYWEGDDRFYFYHESDVEAVINDPACKYDIELPSDEQALEIYRNLPWKKAIFVFIELPDV